MIERDKIYIGGQWVAPEGKEVIEVVNPATEAVIATIPRCVPQDADRAASAAAEAFTGWSNSSIAERVALFNRMADLVEKRGEELTQASVSEVGQPIRFTAPLQTGGAVDELRVMAENLQTITWEEDVGGAVVRRLPSGVVGAITAWNGPLRSVISKAGAAIAAGCTVVVKGSEVAPLTSFIFAEIAHEAGLPPGVFNLLSGTGPEIGEAIVTHKAVDMVSLTGSVRAGRRVMELAAQDVKRVHLELGGKSANILLDDADFEKAVSVGLDDAFRNSGQVCGGLTRMLVPQDRLAEAEELAIAKAQSFVIGDPFDPDTTLGPVISDVAMERVRNYIRIGQEEGARLLTGGTDLPAGIQRGYYVQPTVFSGDNAMRIAREEIFGPVLTIIPYRDEAEAIAIANDSDYGLAGAVWSASRDRAVAVARQIRTGRQRINGAPFSKNATHGGFKHSGFGREWGRFGIEEFTEFQSING
ncbi:aldehyde dehydrogenase family protein [Antarctobacter sp.]|uniref:aldehyde dehydrogenase family protein n=1 Tax=Antarctobacter sp. TaxID=1872577 RepID=UPI003A94B5AF